MPSKIFKITGSGSHGPGGIPLGYLEYALRKALGGEVFNTLVIEEISSEITDAKEGEEMKTKRDTQETINELSMNIWYVRKQCQIWLDAQSILTELFKDVSKLFDDRLGAVQEQYGALAEHLNKLNIEMIQLEDELNTIGSEVKR